MSTSLGARAHPRVDTGERCWIETESVTLYARMENISLGGAFIRTSTPIAEGTVLRLRWSLGEAHADLEAEAVVVWCRPIGQTSGAPAGMGLSFQALGPDLEGTIGAYVTEQLVA